MFTSGEARYTSQSTNIFDHDTANSRQPRWLRVYGVADGELVVVVSVVAGLVVVVVVVVSEAVAAGLAAGAAVSVFCSQAASSAAPAKMQKYLFIVLELSRQY